MNARTFALVLIIVSLVAVSHLAQTQSPVALSGRINSSDGAAIEGVLVSAKKAGSTITTTVVSDEQGQYRFPSTKLTSGQYALQIRAVGYDLDGPREVTIAAGQNTTVDLKLSKTHNLASQLSNSEWLTSFPARSRRRRPYARARIAIRWSVWPDRDMTSTN